MTKKKDFTTGGGFDSLFVKKTQAAPIPEEDSKPKKTSKNKKAASMEEAAPEEQTYEGRGDILSTIEDAELRELIRKKRQETRGRSRTASRTRERGAKIKCVTIKVDEALFNELREAGNAQGLLIQDTWDAAMRLALQAYREKGTLITE